MFRNPFDGARAKIDRSHTHFKELIGLQNAFNKTQPLAIELVPQANGDTIVLARIAALPPIEHSAIVSDILGAFRASLDIAVSQACILRGQTDKKLLNKTYFAFAGSETDWGNNVNNRMAGADAVIRATVKSFRPWKEAGNELLYALSKLAADDKHVDLVPVGAGMGELTIDGLKISRGDGKGCGIQSRVPVWGNSNQVELMTILAPAKVEISGPCVLNASIGFTWEAAGAAGKPVIPVLYQMGTMCEKIVDAIEAAAKLPHT